MYQTEIHVRRDANLRLVFKGVSHTADVLHIPNDYYTYGGITRPVAMECLPDAYIDGLRCTTRRVDGAWQAIVKIDVKALANIAAPLALEISVAGERQICELEPGEAEVVLSIGQPEEWSPESPNLYLLRAVLRDANGNPIDDQIERIGFREIALQGESILLNGTRIFIKGFNRHEDHPFRGCAMTENEMNDDLELLLSTGANAVRTCHYPNDERFLDLCDEKGCWCGRKAMRACACANALAVTKSKRFRASSLASAGLQL